MRSRLQPISTGSEYLVSGQNKKPARRQRATRAKFSLRLGLLMYGRSTAAPHLGRISAVVALARFLAYANPNEANAVIEAQPSATPNTAPASTSLKKCIPSTTRDTAMLIAIKNSGASNPG